VSKGRSLLNFIGGISDRVMTRIPNFMLEHSALPRAEYLERLRFYANWADGAGERPFFVLPAEAPEAEVIERKPIADGERVLLRYPSRFAGHNPALRDALRAATNNQYGYLHVWRHESRVARPLVLCVHGFAMAGPARAESMFKIQRLFERGLDVALHHLPHHWRRSESPPNNPFLRPQDVPLTIEEWVRNIHDLHSARLLLAGLGYGRVGLIGASLGGLTGALYLCAGVAPPLDFVFLVVPAVDLTGYLEPRASLMSFAIDAEVRELTHRAVRRIVPTGYAPRFDVERICVVAHEGDRICPVRYTRELVERWQIRHYTEVVGGHWVYLDHRVRGRTWYGWLESMGYLRTDSFFFQRLPF